MKAASKIIFLLLLIAAVSCNVNDLVSDLTSSKITAKEKLGDVMNFAKTDFAADAQLAAIYGREISTQGEIDLLNSQSLSAFVYVVQSDSLQANEFYSPIFKARPVKSPISPASMLSFIKDSTAKNLISSIFGTLATVHIDPSAIYEDSPETLSRLLNRNDVETFRVVNPTSKIDMFLLPAKSLDSLRAINSADWVVNFYSDTSSLVLWINSSNFDIINLFDL